MRIALTGATGFLGRHVLDRLAGHDVVALSRTPPDDRFVSCDVAHVDVLEERFAGADAVIHAAGLVDHHPDGAARTWAVHVDGTRNVIDACRRAGVKRLVAVGTSGTIAVSEREEIRDESAPPPWDVIQAWPYYRSKLAADDLLLAAEDLDVVILSPSLLLGPGDLHGSSTNLVRWFLQGHVPFAPPGGLSFADARDVADAVVAALDKGEVGSRHLLGAANWSFTRLYEALARIADRPAPRLTAPRGLHKAMAWLPDLGRDGFLGGSPLTRADLELACRFWYLDDAKARRVLGWRPRDPLDTLADTVWDLRQRGLV